MVSFNAVLLLALANPGDAGQTSQVQNAAPRVEMLEFTANWCEACRAMQPAVDRLRRAGVPVRQIDVDQQRDLARKFGVTQIPHAVITVNGRAVSQMRGTSTYGQLASWFRQHQARATTADEDYTVRGQSPGSERPARAAAGPPSNTFADRGPAPLGRADHRRPAGNNLSATDRAMMATVKIKVEDKNGFSFGTGTIIDKHDDEALVLTCGHLFRESGGRGLITIEFNIPNATTVRGELIAWDADKRDIAVISIRPRVSVHPITVAGDVAKLFRGNEVFSIGCNKGKNATIQRSHIVSLNRYGGPANIEVKGQPVNGRSGGGLFNRSGELIGVCRAADSEDDEGIYVGLPVVHSQLDQIGQSRIYKRPASLPTVPDQRSALGQAAPAERHSNVLAAPRDIVPESKPGEMICIIRDNDGRSRMITVPRPSAALVRQLMNAADDRQAIANHRLTRDLQVRGQDE